MSDTVNETFRATQRAKALSGFGKWLVFTFGRSVDEGFCGDRVYHVVKWRGELYRSIEDQPYRPAEPDAVKQRRLPAGFKVSSQLSDS